jgi:DNA adenine methylase
MTLSPLRWAGSKLQLAATITKLMPEHYSVYHEPFIGGGAVFFYARPHGAILGDSNPELVNFYKMNI